MTTTPEEFRVVNARRIEEARAWFRDGEISREELRQLISTYTRRLASWR